MSQHGEVCQNMIKCDKTRRIGSEPDKVCQNRKKCVKSVDAQKGCFFAAQ